MKHILMIATGGTIASKNSGSGLAPALTSTELLSAVPQIGELCKVTQIQPFNLDSTNLYAKHWLQIAQIIEENYQNFDGFVITHGTDTMAYTASALSYLVRDSEKPIVLTGSQKSMSLKDTDARKNLLDAFRFCVDEEAFGVRVVFDGNVILGTRAKKTKTRSYHAFSSVDFPEIAIIRDGRPLWFVKESKPSEVKFSRALAGGVFVLKMIPGMSQEILKYLCTQCDGLILETFGSGGLPDYGDGAFLSILKEYLGRGKTVVVTTQVEREGSSLKSYEVGRKLMGCGNVLEARSMTLESALAKLMWILAQTKDLTKIQKLFYTPVDHDIF